MSLNKLAGSVVSRGFTGGSGQPARLICSSAISPAWTKLWPCGVKGETEAQRWQILVLGPTANTQNGIQTLTEALEVLHNPSTSL